MWAWTPAHTDGTTEYLTVGYDVPMRATGVIVRENFGNGFVTRVDLLDTGNVAHTVWTGTDPTEGGNTENFVITVPTTSYAVKGVRVYVNT
ncbi:MAG: hypothetical protein C4321_03660, partial [Chloroflexota bacterium]